MKKPLIINEFVERIKLDKEHGASQLGREALKALKLFIKKDESKSLNEFLTSIEEAGFKLANARLNMAPLINLVGKTVYLIKENSRNLSLKELKKFAILKIDEIIFESENAVNKIAELTSKIIKDKAVITHSFSSTIIEAIKKSKVKKVIVSESRPLFEGRKTVVQLSKFKIPVILVTDAALGFFSSKAEVALVGCDSILSNGSIINKVGTYLLALAAKDNNIPFYVVSETIKINPKSFHELKLEEGCEREVAENLPKKVKVKNLYFDVTKPSLITALITEEGIIKSSEVKNKMKEFKKYVKALKIYK
ncbi:translation initiation factor eIF-2B [Candidatus Bathyarchaeota archaeon]|nr:translation initiation factor eIF-2B [Candidatus Bathyarchaeota archaeon]